MMKVRYIAIGAIVIFAIVVGVRLILVSTDTSEDTSNMKNRSGLKDI